MNTSHVDAGNDGKSEYGVDYGSFKWKARLEDLEQKRNVDAGTIKSMQNIGAPLRLLHKAKVKQNITTCIMALLSLRAYC